MATISAAQVACYAMKAGFLGTSAARMVVIAKLESGFKTDARNPIKVCTATECGHAVGLWQVVDFPSRVAKYGDLTDPSVNARAAKDIYDSQGLRAWTTWTVAVGYLFQAALATGSIFGINIPSLPTRIENCGGQDPNSTIPGIPGNYDIGSTITNAEHSTVRTLTSIGAGIIGITVITVGLITGFSVLAPRAAPAVKDSVQGLAKAALMLVK